MSQPIIEVEKLSKRYRLGQFNARTLREEADYFFRRLSGKKADAPPQTDFWALRDVSFTVEPGEVVGIIGRNGAGKSTLLKILSRVTEPTNGQARIRGRVASLLEVGTGFHPELTGRENIYLNGAILGMSRAEIKAKFDEIADFAEIERFLDTPVKRYSSGMYVRLAFAVAAHLEPEILIVDEVLAVGDMEFQRKCLGKMQEMNATGGRTVIFVSHDMAAVEALTTRSILLHEGAICGVGRTADVISQYVQVGLTYRGVTQTVVSRGQHSRVLRAAVIDDQSRPSDLYSSDKPLRLKLDFETDGSRALSFDIYLSDSKGQRIYHYSSERFDAIFFPKTPGTYVAECSFGPLRLASGEYSIDVATIFANIGYDHYASQLARFSVPYYSPGAQGWNFVTTGGFGLIAMTPLEKIAISEGVTLPINDAALSK